MTAPHRPCKVVRPHPSRLVLGYLAALHGGSKGGLEPSALAAHLGPGPAHAALPPASAWPVGSTLRVAFAGGSSDDREGVLDAMHEWSKYANLEFVEVLSGPAEVRCSFDQSLGSWSAIGRDALAFDPAGPTMNMGWPDDPARDRHEVGHALGLIHEHQNPLASIPWNALNVVRDLSGPPNNWSVAEIQSQVLNPDPEPLTNGGYDRLSIMEYPIPPSWVLDPSYAVAPNPDLSDGDRAFAARLYPGRPSPPGAPPAAPSAVPTTTVPPDPAPEPPVSMPVSSVKASLLALLSWVPGEVSKEVNLGAFASAIGSAELADPLPPTAAHVLSVAGHAVVRNAAAIFPNPLFRTLAVTLLEQAYGPAS